jgi:uncharacterized protein (TIGR03435 family)
MAWTKTKTALVVGAAVMLGSGTAVISVNTIEQHKTYPWQNMNGGDDLVNSPPQLRILPSKFSEYSAASRSDKMLATGVTLKEVLAAAYGVASSHVIFSTKMPREKFDFIANLPADNEAALRTAVKRKFGLVGKPEIHETDALLLKVKNPTDLQPYLFKGQSGFKVPQGLQFGECSLTEVAAGLETVLKTPVVDQTGMSGEYHLQFLPEETPQTSRTMEARMDTVRQTLFDELDQAGLELVPTNMPLEMLMVEKAIR